MNLPLHARWLGLQPYAATWQAMRRFTDQRDASTADEVWLLEHPPVFTQGLAGKPEHVLAPGDIPVIQTDRGGQVTYHGPGQLVLYPLLDLERLQLGVRCLVDRLEQVVIDLLGDYGLHAQRREAAPGVYVNGAKIASIGLKVRRGCTYHGLALNIDNDLAPFARINPCGYAGLSMTRMVDLLGPIQFDQVAGQMLGKLAETLGLDVVEAATDDAGVGSEIETPAPN
ncbi:MAG: octanoyltransferase [Gammaproteobacteria bacterium HGW-Gammaproteobacteria-8]|nr:MAG: octanoyltransferase [Gammaproteobacteria bacterium HGW-Gammaproteobacteria-8]